MLLKPNPEVEDQAKKTTVEAKEEEVTGLAMAEIDTEADQPLFKQKMGSVFPKKRRSVKGLMFDYVRNQLCSTSADQTSQVEKNTTTASSAALFPEETNAAIKAKRVHPQTHLHLHGY